MDVRSFFGEAEVVLEDFVLKEVPFDENADFLAGESHDLSSYKGGDGCG